VGTKNGISDCQQANLEELISRNESAEIGQRALSLESFRSNEPLQTANMSLLADNTKLTMGTKRRIREVSLSLQGVVNTVEKDWTACELCG